MADDYTTSGGNAVLHVDREQEEHHLTFTLGETTSAEHGEIDALLAEHGLEEMDHNEHPGDELGDGRFRVWCVEVPTRWDRG